MPKNDSEKSLLMSCMINANINLYIIAWPLRKDDTHIREAFHFFFRCQIRPCQWSAMENYKPYNL